MKKVVFSIFTMLFCVYSYAQELPKVVPPSPTAYELGKYGETPKGNFTGTVQANVPLLVYKTTNLSVPLYLSYSSNGIKVDQMESNVGLGWSLNAGGVISRTVRQRPDEDRTTSIPEAIYSSVTSPAVLKYLFDSSQEDSKADAQVDVFNFNFLGKTGKFVLDKNKQPVLLTGNSLQITFTNKVFEITDELGIQYTFRTTESSQSKSKTIGGVHEPWSDLFTTSWYLSEINHPKGDQITFVYEADTKNYNTGESHSLRKHSDNHTTATYYKTSKSISYGIFNGVLLKEIYSNQSTSGMVLLTNVEHFTKKIELKKSNTIFEEVSFKYLKNSKERVFLEEVTFKDPAKKYTFNYINPVNFPARLSYSQDHWGYYNGKSNSTYFFPNPSITKNMSGVFENYNGGANREIEGNLAQTGLLQKITYPTKGYTSFEYESNTYYGSEEIQPPRINKALAANTSSTIRQRSSSFVFDEITDHQEVNFFTDLLYLANCETFAPPHRERAEIKIENLSGGAPSFYTKTSGEKIYIGSSFYISPNQSKVFYASLTKNTKYRVTITTESYCLKGNLRFSYYKGSPTLLYKNIPTGGMRVKKIINTSSNANENEITRFYYAKKDNLTRSTGYKGLKPWYVRAVKNKTLKNGVLVDDNYSVLMSSSIRNLYHNEGAYGTKYPTVTVSYGGDNFEKGGEELTYNIGDDLQGRLMYGDRIEGSVNSVIAWKNGLLKNATKFKKVNGRFITVHTTENLYKRDSRINSNVRGVSVRKNYDLFRPYDPSKGILNIENLDVMTNTFVTNWHYKYRTIEKQFDENGSNPIINTTNYFYDNANHLQLTRTETTDANDLVLKTQTFYPNDKNKLSGLSATASMAIDHLISEHRIAEPIQVKTFIGTALQATERTNYKNFKGLYLPETIQTAKGSLGMENRVVYHNYDNKGNPIEVSKQDGTKTYYAWGYHRTQPIAKIEGYTSLTTAQKTAINNAITASNNDVSEATENTLRTRLQSLRDSFTNKAIQVTTFTYDPLVGVTSITDPRGKTTYYTYDGFNRLHLIKDSNNQIVKENQYHYKN
ncbi:putative YD repeat-containing protein [Tenacibaculum sp. 190524A02b]|uniref:hypothetical protein n=1 Tax=Tenacibaculum vairaonense TaxID=3137860 RepID=UPI0032B10621